uniref:Uncharacterized protein n=1 Tax=Anguilla anguilla TaxID=7936 RepID=A0A0E9U004_ANGAN
MYTGKYSGGSLMLWGCAASTDPWALVKTASRTLPRYQDILARNMVASASRLKATSGSQNGDLKHTLLFTNK